MKTPYYVARGWLPVEIAFCPSEAAFTKLKRAHDIEKSEPYPFIRGQMMALCKQYTDPETGASVVIVFMEKFEALKPIEVTGYLIHEAVHVWQFIKKHVGIKKPDYETEAYSIQNIAQGLMQAHELTIGKDDGS